MKKRLNQLIPLIYRELILFLSIRFEGLLLITLNQRVFFLIHLVGENAVHYPDLKISRI